MTDNFTESEPHPVEENVLGGPLIACCFAPKTGFERDGFCSPHPLDAGHHTVCALMTEAFLAFSKMSGNDLSTPHPEMGFPGLQPGDYWCLCAPRWLQAYEAGQAPMVQLKACSEHALDIIPLEALMEYGLDRPMH